MQRILLPAAAPALMLLLTLLLMTAQAGTTRSVLLAVTAHADVPIELRPLFEEQEQRYGISWPYMAAYVRHQLQDGWQLPISSRVDRLQAHEHYNRQLRDDPCHPETTQPEPEPGTCEHYQVPSDQPIDRAAIEALWLADARSWLDQQLYTLFGVTGDTGMLAVPLPRDVMARIQLQVSADAWQRIDRQGRLYAEWYRALSSEPDALALVDGEDYTLHLKALDWRYHFPVQGGGTYTNDWGFDRPHNQGYASTRHQGTDLFAPEGTPLIAVTDGVVVRAGWNYLGGWTVAIRGDFDQLTYYYAHLQAPAPVTAGQRVHQGQVIGQIGRSGEGPEGHMGIAEPHLHFGIYTDAKQAAVTSPFPYLKAWERIGSGYN